jgi:hypothetical protein
VDSRPSLGIERAAIKWPFLIQISVVEQFTP